MPRIQLDAKDAVLFGNVDPDRYLVEIVDVSDVKVGQQKGTRYVEVKAEIVEGAETGAKFAGQNLWRNCPVEGKGAGMFIDLWNKAHVDDESAQLEVGDEIDVDTDELIGRQVCFVTKDREYPPDSGEFRSEVDRVVSA